MQLYRENMIMNSRNLIILKQVLEIDSRSLKYRWNCDIYLHLQHAFSIQCKIDEVCFYELSGFSSPFIFLSSFLSFLYVFDMHFTDAEPVGREGWLYHIFIMLVKSEDLVDNLVKVLGTEGMLVDCIL